MSLFTLPGKSLKSHKDLRYDPPPLHGNRQFSQPSFGNLSMRGRKKEKEGKAPKERRRERRLFLFGPLFFLPLFLALFSFVPEFRPQSVPLFFCVFLFRPSTKLVPKSVSKPNSFSRIVRKLEERKGEKEKETEEMKKEMEEEETPNLVRRERKRGSDERDGGRKRDGERGERERERERERESKSHRRLHPDTLSHQIGR